jgi:hypothetical protein
LAPGALEARLVVEGVPLEDLAAGTRLRVGEAVVIEVLAGPAGGGGLVEAPGSAPVGGRVLAGGMVAAGAAVAVDAVPVAPGDWLDLHPFRPGDVAAVVDAYLEEARGAGRDEVRLVHGRGRGVQRALVRAVLAASPHVLAFADAPAERGGWGATVVRLRPAAP